MNHFFEEYGWCCLSMLAGMMFLSLMFEVLFSLPNGFVGFINDVLARLMS